MDSCRETPGCPISTRPTNSLTDRSPPRRASTSRRRVGSARTWNTSGMTTYYCYDICRVNDILGTYSCLRFPEVGQRLGDPLRQRLRALAAQVDHLLGDALLLELRRQLDELPSILAVPAELDRPPDLGRVAAHRPTRFLEHRGQLLDALGVTSGDVPHVGVAGDEAKRRRA